MKLDILSRFLMHPFAAANKPQSCAQGNPPLWQDWGFVSPESFQKWVRRCLSMSADTQEFCALDPKQPRHIPQLRGLTRAVVVRLHSLCWLHGEDMSLLSSRADPPLCTSWASKGGFAATISSEFTWKMPGTIQGMLSGVASWKSTF